jgi:hypothetical protein
MVGLFRSKEWVLYQERDRAVTRCKSMIMGILSRWDEMPFCLTRSP